MQAPSTATEEIYSATSYPYNEYDYAPTDTSVDPRDEIIRQNQKQITRMQRNFKRSAEELRMQLRDYVQQSTGLQEQMLDRILRLKEQIKAIQDRQEFFNRKLPGEKHEQKSAKKKKSTRKNRTTTV